MIASCKQDRKRYTVHCTGESAYRLRPQNRDVPHQNRDVSHMALSGTVVLSVSNIGWLLVLADRQQIVVHVLTSSSNAVLLKNSLEACPCPCLKASSPYSLKACPVRGVTASEAKSAAAAAKSFVPFRYLLICASEHQDLHKRACTPALFTQWSERT